MIAFLAPRNENSNDKFEEYLKPSFQKFSEKNFLMFELFNSDANSICKKYNLGLEKAEKYLNDSDIVCFCHADVKIHDENFAEKIEMVFNKRKDVGVLGVIGTIEYGGAGWWSNSHNLHRGHLIQGLPGSDGKNTYHMVRKIGFFDDLVVIDGFCFFMPFGIAKELKFDDNLGGYHFYDYDICMRAKEKGLKVACADILLEHASEGPLDPTWFELREKFLKKWSGKGYNIPITNESFNKK